MANETSPPVENVLKSRLPTAVLLIPLSLAVLAIAIVVVLESRFSRLTASQPLLSINEQLSIQLTEGNLARLRIVTTAQERVFGAEGAARWASAREALPDHVTPLSDLIEVAARSGSVQLAWRLPEAQGLVQVYAWDDVAERWTLVPSTVDGSTGALTVDAIDQPLALFASDSSLQIGALWGEYGIAPAAAVHLDALYIPDVQIDADAVIDDSAIVWGEFPSGVYRRMPVVAPTSDATDPDQWADALAAWLEAQEADGLLLDLTETELNEALLLAVSESLRPAYRLELLLSGPVLDEAGWTTPFDWAQVSPYADGIVLDLPLSPDQFTAQSPLTEFLSQASEHIDTSQIHLRFSVLSIDQWAGRSTPIATDYALAPLGEVVLQRTSLTDSPKPGDSLTFELDSDMAGIEQEAASGLHHYTIYAGGGEHQVWIMTGDALRRRLDTLAGLNVGGVLLTDLNHPGTSSGILRAISEFRSGQPSTLPTNLALQWTVEDTDGSIIEQLVTELMQPLTWVAPAEGDYVIRSAVISDGATPLGAQAVIVGGETVGVVPEQENVVTGASEGLPQAPPAVELPPGLAPPIVPAGAFGRFELGGQVNHVVNNPGQMQAAGMEWVKFQLAWSPDTDSQAAWTLIEEGRAQGFKVLISVTGRDKYPDEINYEAYIEFLREVAYAGPEAIEVWNEPNLDFEWPRGEIDGRTYTWDMLAPAYNAIKSVNRNIMVISAAPAPTGLYYAEGGCSGGGFGCDDWLFLQQMAEAGAANYMDCVGAHYNSGATAPSATTGHPADPGYQHYSWYFGGMLQLYGGTFGRPVCFTELGYLSGEGWGSVPPRFDWASQTSVTQQAAWLAEAAQLSQQSGNVRLMIVWNVDFEYWGDDPMGGYAIIRPDGTCPACDTLGNVMR
ncbi:MAG: hypothetical protein GYB68_00660 [Chloroflexi bacterium]|nr:hypothetical protein [Chloroflexota bacterium]